MIAERGLPQGPAHDPNHLLRRPGLKVLHVPDVDFRTTVLTLVQALRQVREWSLQHPHHFPIMIMIEIKGGSGGRGSTTIPFDGQQMDTIDAEILSVFDDKHVLKPDDVRGDFETLRQAVARRGWPRLDDARGKVMFAMDNEGEIRDRYLNGHHALQGRLLFVSVEASHPAAAFMKLNDAIGQFDHIQEMVQQGFLVRTRADVRMVEARQNDPTRRDKAFTSGAQFISTDYPQPDRALSEYQVRFRDNIVVRTNPVNGNAELAGRDLEQLER